MRTSTSLPRQRLQEHAGTSRETDLVERFSGQGIGGTRKIPVSDAVSKENRVPDEIKSLGHRVVKLYLDARIRKIEEHNAVILESLIQETYDLRNATRGMGVVSCPECEEDVPWGSLMDHRTRLCRNCRV
jgi:hypothetical protein